MENKVLNIEVPGKEFTVKFDYGDEKCEIVFKRVTIPEIAKIRDEASKLKAMEEQNPEEIDVTVLENHLQSLFDMLAVKTNFDWKITTMPLASVKVLLETAMGEQGIPADKKKL